MEKFVPPKFEFHDDIPLNERDFDEISRLIYQKSGLKLGPHKKSMIQSRLGRRLRVLKLDNYREYLKYLDHDKSGELINFINAMTTNKTDFFREIEHFNFFKRDIMENKRRDITIWSAACSTGEEVYSISMICEELKDRLGYFIYKILGSDIDTEILQRATEGIYKRDILSPLMPQQVYRFFERGKGTNEGYYRVRKEFKSNIKFRWHNLIDENLHWPIQFDYIFLRNVLIYFDTQTIQKVIDKVSSHLKRNGILLIGHSETLNGVRHKLTPMGNALFIKDR